MKKEVLNYLINDPEGLYLDCTVGTGGHSLAILQSNQDTRVIGIDRDQEALEIAKERTGEYAPRIEFFLGNFRDAGEYLRGRRCDGFLLDLGLSSYQLSDESRGFSYMKDGPLDMAMGSGSRSVAGFITSAEMSSIKEVLREFGEVRKPGRIARRIIEERERGSIERTFQLKEIIEGVVPPHRVYGTLSRVFQALRIWANRELESLDDFLRHSLDLLNSGGRMVIISYHSLEDRMVKTFFREKEKGCICPPDFPVCSCGREPELRIITRRPVLPSGDEIAANSRSRSAKLRAAERI
ncbi:MAG: 16S rRNA (cytosine(1402)-N(4))-methyltransferase RsmH [Candidatus Latescibacteria bacterium]|nr:16S rRNA (cytosine(1402)-N(4))-methyltransferase RsmH [bacterium]MBD3424744.1 16S rRNA (cytosine(1402)-N(4))-methyltransferase RsmH [Candidatus Latescibacterota bacterium]